MNDNIKIFLCAHKPIENNIPKDKRYIIIDVSGTVKDDFHEVIDISEDEFTKNHNVAYSEGCAMKWLYNHPEVIPDYICFGHYRRMFLKLVGKEDEIPEKVEEHGAIVKKPFHHYTNELGMYADHPADDTRAFIASVKEAAPRYWHTFERLLRDNKQYACNIFAMKKEDFLEMCEMCFKVLDHFDKKQGYTNNEDVYNKMVLNSEKIHLKRGVDWQKRLQGFWLEWLTDLYFRHKFKNRTLKLKAGIPK